MAPRDMRHAVAKITAEGNDQVLLTERGVSFGYNNLVVDMRALPMLRELGYPVVFDVTHSLQLPGAGDGVTAGLAEYIEPLASAGVARRRGRGVHGSPRASGTGEERRRERPPSRRARAADPQAGAHRRRSRASARSRRRRSEPPDDAGSADIDLALARRVLQTEAAAILALVDRLDDDFERAVRLLLDCRGRVIVTGMGKSGIICRKIAATLSSTGTPAFFLHPAEAIHGDLGVAAGATT